jgi:hypothetical protein
MDRIGDSPLATGREITRTARSMIDEYGGHAWPSAISRAKDLLASGQKEASVKWFEVAREIAQLRHGTLSRKTRK